MGVGTDIMIRNMFIEIKYCVSYTLVIFITNYRWFRMLKVGMNEVTNLSIKILCKTINSIP